MSVVGSRRLLVSPQFVSADGVQLATYGFGGDGPPLLLVHATGFHAHCWLPLVEHLRPHFTVFAFDLRGHGESAPASDYSYRRMSQDLLVVADHFRLERLAAIGHSVGGALIVQASIWRPSLVSRAVLYEPIVLPPEQTEETAAAAAARTRRVVFDSTTQMIERWSARGPFAAFDPEALRAYVEYGVRDRPDGTVELKCSREAEVATFVEDTRSGIWAQLPQYRTPTLVLVGGRSTSRAAPLVERQAALMGSATVERYPELSHFLPFEAPRPMSERALAFLRK